MCETNSVLITVEKRVYNDVCVVSGLFGFEDSVTGDRSVIPVNLYLYTVGDTEVDDIKLYREMVVYAHNMKYHSPTQYNS